MLDLASGALRWEQEIDYFTAAPVVHAGRVLIAEGDGHFHAVVLSLDVATGELRWGTQVRASFESEIVPAVDDRAFVVVDHYGHVTALDPSDGSVLWERSLDQTVLGTRVALTDRRVTLSTAEWDVFTLDRANGRIVRRTTAARLGGYAVDLTPAPFSRDDGVVVAIRLGDRRARRAVAGALTGRFRLGAPRGLPATLTPTRASARDHARPSFLRSLGARPPVSAGGGTTEEHPDGPRLVSLAPPRCTNEKDEPWQKQRRHRRSSR